MTPIEQIQNHRSIRKYQDRPVPAALLSDILRTGTRAASSGNMQFYSVIVTQDLAGRQRLFEAHKRQSMILEAPVLLTFCADQRRITDWMTANDAAYAGDNSLGLHRGVVDACLVAQNVVVAAELSGLGTCYMGSTLTGSRAIAEILELPELVFPVTSIVMGYPNESPARVERLPMEAVIHHETYPKRSPQQTAEFYRSRDADAFPRLSMREDLREALANGQVRNAPQAYVATKFQTDYLRERSTALEQFLSQHFVAAEP